MSAETVTAWFAGRLPDDWFTEAPEISVDRDEILVVGRLPDPNLPEGTAEAERGTAETARIQGFREDTRAQRMQIAEEAQQRFRKKVSWGARCGNTGLAFTNLSIPVMTRLRLKERRVLDTLVESGVARSRSHALAWCVRLVGENESKWIDNLRDALGVVEKVRAEGPGA